MLYDDLKRLYNNADAEDFALFVNWMRNENAQQVGLTVPSLADNLIEEELPHCLEIARKCLEPGYRRTDEEKLRLLKLAKLICATLNLYCSSNSRKSARQEAMLLLELASCAVRTRTDFTDCALKCCSLAIKESGISWKIVESAPTIDILAQNLVNNVRFVEGPESSMPIDYHGAGIVNVEDEKLHVTSASTLAAGLPAFSTRGGAVTVSTGYDDERLKASEAADCQAIADFANSFEREQLGRIQRGRRTVPHDGESYTIQITGINSDGRLVCSPLELPDERFLVKNEELVRNFHTSDMPYYLCEDDCIEGAVLQSSIRAEHEFSIRDAFRKYAKRAAEADKKSGTVYPAKVIGRFVGNTPDKNRWILLSAKGYPCLMKQSCVAGGCKKGDVLVLKTVSVITDRGDLYINAEPAPRPYSDAPVQFKDDDVLQDFVTTADDARREMDRKQNGNDPDISLLRSLAVVLMNSIRQDPLDRYREAIIAVFILNALNCDDELLQYARARVEYMRGCLRLAEGKDVEDPSENIRFTGSERRTLAALCLLRQSGNIGSIAKMLAEAEERGGDDSKLARQIMAYALSADAKPQNCPGIRKKICDILGVARHFMGSVSRGGGKYGTGELDTVEFKSSYVFSNRTGQPDIDAQGRGQVFEAACGLLNAKGGTVYVGVNDSGDPNGLTADLEWFSGNYDRVNLLRMHRLGRPATRPRDLDSYSRFLIEERNLYFKPSLHRLITITPTEDGDAIRIEVSPAQFEIAKLYTDNTWQHGTVYVRDGTTTRPMRPGEQAKRLMKLRSVGKIEKFIVTLRDAIDDKRKVILKGYASSNSNMVEDRLVVPINLVYNDENLWAYDLDRRTTKEFRLSRIQDIDTDVEDAAYPHAFEERQADIFRWISDQGPYHIRLRLSMAALNSLREEYSNTSNLPEEELYPDSDESYWILDTQLQGLAAVRRFYLGLADQIEILDTEHSGLLREEIRKFVADNIKGS